MQPLLAQTASEAPESVDEAANLLLDSVTALWEGFVARLPLIGMGIVLILIGWLLAGWISGWASRGARRAGGDAVVSGLVGRLTRLVVLMAVILLGLNVAGVSVSAALAGLGIAGLAIAFALQSILENFVAGLLLIIRKPFKAGDQVQLGDYEGTVTDIDLRTTRVLDYSGELVIIPNATVFSEPIVNLTHTTKRRSSIAVGIDYRDDHNAAAGVIKAAVEQVEGVLQDSEVDVLCSELGDSSVNYEVRYWTAPRSADVAGTRDRVLRATKTALDDAGFSIPWPITTLVMDDLQDNVVSHRAVD